MMFNLNFAQRPFRNYTLFYTLFGICASIVFILTLYNFLTYIQNKREFAEYAYIIHNNQQREQTAQKESAELVMRLKREDTKELLKQVNFINEKIQLRTFSWSDFFKELEIQLPPDVKLASIKPRGKEGEIEIQLSITGKTLGDVLDFIDNLNNSPAFDEVFPRRESRNQMSSNFIDYQIYLKYFPEKVPREAPEEVALATARGESQKNAGPSDGARFILETGRLSATGIPFIPEAYVEMPSAGTKGSDEMPADIAGIPVPPADDEGAPDVFGMEEEAKMDEAETAPTEVEDMDVENLVSDTEKKDRKGEE